jgi:hypothetical protein
MRQQINLYQPMFRPQKQPLPAMLMVQVLAAAAAIMLLVFGYDAWRTHALAAEVDAREAERLAAEQALEQVKQRHPPREPDQALQNEVAGVAREIDLKEQLVERLAQGAFGNTAGFSSYLEGMARQHVQGTWLTGFSISGGGQVIALSGRSLAPELVPIYVQRLAGEAAFSGKSFNHMDLLRAESAAEQIDFVLQTHPPATKG